MCESLEGRMTIATRQCAGSLGDAAPPRCGAPAASVVAPSPAGAVVIGPASTHRADVTIVLGSDSFESDSHCDASVNMAASNNIVPNMSHPLENRTALHYAASPCSLWPFCRDLARELVCRP